MALTQLAPPYPIFTDKSGSPLDNGYLYFGEVNKNPETNPIQVYYDSAFTQPAAQPLRTSNGYVMRNGSPALIYAGSQFSVTVRNKQNELVTYSPAGFGVIPFAPVTFATSDFAVKDVATLLADVNYTYAAGVPGTIQVSSGDILRTLAEGFAYEVAASGATDEHVTTAGGVKLYVLPMSGIIHVAAFVSTLDGITDNSAALVVANDAANTANSALCISGIIHVGSTVTITAPMVDTDEQIFSTTSLVTIDNGLPVRPEWFEMTTGAVARAINALPASGGVVQLENKTYPANGYFFGAGGAGTGNFVSKSNVSIVGRKMPTPTNDCKALIGGSVIQGYFLVYADGFSASDVGFDAGYTYRQTTGAGASDALALTYGDTALKAGGALRRRAALHNVIGLCSGPNDPFHGVIAGEGYTDVTCTGDLIGMYGVHGVVIKCTQLTAQNVKAYLNYTDGLIIKSDNHGTDVSSFIQIGNVMSFADGPEGYAPYVLPVATDESIGVFIHAYRNHISQVQIGQILEQGHKRGFHAQFDGTYTIDNLQIGRITTDANSEFGVSFLALAAGTSFQRVQIGDIVTRNTPTGLVTGWTDTSSVVINSITAVNCVNAVANTGNGDPTIGVVTAEGCQYVYEITSAASPRIGATTVKGPNLGVYNTTGSGTKPTLINGWVQVLGGEVFAILPVGYGFQLRGTVSPGTSNLLCTLPAWCRPSEVMTRAALGYAGSSQIAIPITIFPTGNVVVNNDLGGTANCTNWAWFDIQWPV